RCFSLQSFDFDDSDTAQPTFAFQQDLAQNGVWYGNGIGGNGSDAFTNGSQNPGNGVPPQPMLAKLFFMPNQVSTGTPDLRFRDDAGLGASFEEDMNGFDYNRVGMMNIGLEPDMLQDLVNGRRNTVAPVASLSSFTDMQYQMRFLFRGAEDLLESWEKT